MNASPLLELPAGYRISTPEEVVPILLDPVRSPVVSLDTEYDSRVSTYRAPLHGLSMAGGTPETGIIGCFWPYEKGYERQPWSFVRDRVLIPIFSDPARIVVQHPPKVDMQTLHPRGIAEDIVRCRIECTMSMLHCFDENLPKGLKDVGECLLGVRGLQSYAQTQKMMNKLRKDGERAVRHHLQECWDAYQDHRKKPNAPPPTQPLLSHQRLAMVLPHKLKREDVEAALEGTLRRVIVEGDYARRIRAIFEHYAALDALLTLGLRYFLMREIEAEAAPFVTPGTRGTILANIALETAICHPIVTEMEEAGLKIDIPLLSHIKAAMDAAMANLRDDVIARWGFAPDASPDPDPATGVVGLGPADDDDEFNPGSTDQLAQIVWNVWKLRPPPWAMRDGVLVPKWKRAKDGLCKVDKNVLGWLADNVKEPYCTHIARLLEWKSFATLMSNFVGPLLALALADPLQRIHASFWPVGARTGRFSASSPNAENIPRPHTMPTLPVPPGADGMKPPPGVNAEVEKDKATGVVKKITWRVASLRSAFISEPGWSFVSADLAQVENRLVAHESQDEAMFDLFTLWDCGDCKASGRTTDPLHKCPSCGAPDGKRDKSKPTQPAIKGFCLGRDIHAASSVALGLDIKYGAGEGRQRAKCVSTQTVVVTSAGLMRVGDLARDVASGMTISVRGLETLAPTGVLVPLAQVSRPPDGVKRSVIVVTRRGVLRCSLEHRIVTVDGLVPAAELRPGTQVPLVPVPARWVGADRTVRVNIFGDGTKYAQAPLIAASGQAEMTLDSRWGYFAGAIAGDGTACHGGFSIAVGGGDAYAVWRATLLALCAELGLPASLASSNKCIRIGSRRVGSFLCELELSDARTKHLAIPSWVLRGSETTAWAYLAGLIDTDGTVSPLGTTSITSKHPEFVGEIALMARCLGLAVNIEPCFNATYSRWYFRLHFLSSGLSRILECAPLRSEKRARLAARVARIRYPNRARVGDVVVQVFDVTTQGSSRRADITSPIYVAAEDPIPMADLGVATDDHLYAPSGIATHNSFNHAASYGMGARTLARREGMKLVEAEEGLAAWHLRYPRVKPLHARITQEIVTRGYVTMWDGHVRHFAAQRLLKNSNNFHEHEWEGVVREGVNVLAQGGTGVGMKRAMIRIRKRLREHENPLVRKTRLVNQIHDELLYECPTAVAKAVYDIIVWELEHAFELRVPILAEGGWGPTWLKAHA